MPVVCFSPYFCFDAGCLQLQSHVPQHRTPTYTHAFQCVLHTHVHGHDISATQHAVQLVAVVVAMTGSSNSSSRQARQPTGGRTGTPCSSHGKIWSPTVCFFAPMSCMAAGAAGAAMQARMRWYALLAGCCQRIQQSSNSFFQMQASNCYDS